MFGIPLRFSFFCYFLPFESTDLICPPLDLWSSAHPAAQAGQLPQLQHHPGAPAARRSAEGAFQATTQQGVSHHAALQVSWLGLSAASFFELKAGNLKVKLKLNCCGRMLERPTPSMHDLSRTHRWEGNTVILSLPSSVLSSKNTWQKKSLCLMISIIHSINLQLQGLVIWPCWMLILQSLPDARMWANRWGTVSEWTAVCACPGTPKRGSGLTAAAEQCERMRAHQSTAGTSWKCSLNSHTCRQRFPRNKCGHLVSVVTSWGPRRWCSSRSTAATTPPTWMPSSGGQIRGTVFSADASASGVSCWLSTVSLLPLLYISMPSNLTVLCVLLLCVCPYIPGWVACKRADAISEENQRVHHLSDNCPHDQYLYAVTIHTGPCSAPCMSAKVKCCASYVTV